jgi:PIN domain nuclease of toxin-antitoxin system
LIQIDTHVAIWLATRREYALSAAARRAVAREQLQISPMVAMELETLWEDGKLRSEPERILGAVEQSLGLTRSQASFASVIEAARTFAWTRDPFDRLIVANAIADGVRLLTGDDLILRHFKGAVW